MDVYVTTKISPVLGLFSETEQTGWLWDRSLLVSGLNESFSYNTFTGSISYKLRDGTIISDWQSGSLGDLKYLSLSKLYQPLIYTGNFTVSSSMRTLYSDFSYTSYVSPLNDNEDGNNTHTLPSDAITGTLSLYSFRRDRNLIHVIVDEFIPVDEFTEDSYSNEYTAVDTLITLNNNYIRKHGINPETATWDNIRTWGIFLSNGIDAQRDFYCTYFPVVPDTVRSFILYSDGTIEEWTFVDDFNFVFDTEKVLVLNLDLGVVSCGGYKPDDLVLYGNISSSDIEIQFYTTTDIDTYPTQGIIHIGDETIAYTDRTHNEFLNCTRGYNGTTAVTHVVGDAIEYEQRGATIPSNAALYLYYESTVRVDCEVTDSTIRTGLVDCRPSKNSSASEIVQISSKLRDLDRLVLESDKPSLGANSYGPLYFGNDISKLTVTAYDSLDNPVDDLAITLEILDPIIGLLDGESSEVTKYSNSDGKIFTYYNAPIDADEFSTKFSEVTYSGATTIFTLDSLGAGTEIEDIYIFQLLKQDPTYGTSGEKYEVDSYTYPSTREGASFEVTLFANLQDNFDGGVAYFVMSDAVIKTRNIVQGYDNKLYCSGDDLFGTPDSVWILTDEDIEWDANELNGVPVIVYAWDDNVEHPITGEDGAWTPIKPSDIAGDVVTYSYVLPQSAPEDRSSNLGGYMIIAPAIVGLRAKAIDPYSGETIYSNTIYLTIKLPNYLVGVDYSGALPIPKGFNLKILEEDVGNGIGGANFLSINRKGGLFGLQLRFDS